MTKRLLLAVTLLSLAAAALPAADWPQFRGPNRDGLSAETGLLQAWPAAGPRVLWENSDLGQGFAGAAVVKGTVYTSGNVGNDFAVTALDPAGKQLWQKPLDKAVMNGHAGARSTPTVDGELLFVETDAGRVFCLKTADGSTVWSVNLIEKYAAKPPAWAYSENLLVDGDHVFVCPGGKAAMVALNKKTGLEVWASPPFDEVTYAAPVLMPLGKLKQVVGFTSRFVFAVNAETGRKLWSYPVEQRNKWNATSVVFHDDVVYATTCAGVGGVALKLTVADGQVTPAKLWANPAPDDQNGGVVLVAGRIFGTGQTKRGLTAVDFEKGNTVFTNKDVGLSSVIYADGRLYCAGETGEVCLCDPKADGKIISKFAIAVKGKMWAHPAISDGKLYIRHDAALTVYDIKTPPVAEK